MNQISTIIDEIYSYDNSLKVMLDPTEYNLYREFCQRIESEEHTIEALNTVHSKITHLFKHKSLQEDVYISLLEAISSLEYRPFRYISQAFDIDSDNMNVTHLINKNNEAIREIRDYRISIRDIKTLITNRQKENIHNVLLDYLSSLITLYSAIFEQKIEQPIDEKNTHTLEILSNAIRGEIEIMSKNNDDFYDILGSSQTGNKLLSTFFEDQNTLTYPDIIDQEKGLFILLSYGYILSAINNFESYTRQMPLHLYSDRGPGESLEGQQIELDKFESIIDTYLDHIKDYIPQDDQKEPSNILLQLKELANQYRGDEVKRVRELSKFPIQSD